MDKKWKEFRGSKNFLGQEMGRQSYICKQGKWKDDCQFKVFVQRIIISLISDHTVYSPQCGLDDS